MIWPYIRYSRYLPMGAQDQDNFVRNLITVLLPGGGYEIRPLMPSPSARTLGPPVLTLPEIKLHCRIEADQTAEDSLLTNLEMAAHLHTENELRIAIDASVGENVKQAMLLLIAYWYRNRESVADGKFIELPLAYKALLSAEADYPLGFY
jgi:uncharacterized phage protein (predicted DNA packaging)